jgi:hypothetical protein
MKKMLFLGLALLTGCASNSVKPPSRPVPATAQAAECLRQCEAINAACVGNAHTGAGMPIASTTGGILVGAMIAKGVRDDAIEACYGTLKGCYQDCEHFSSQTKSSNGEERAIP